MGVRKQGDRVGQVAIGRLAPRDEPADARQDVEEIIVVHRPPQFRRGSRELEYTGTPARTQHPEHLLQAGAEIGHVPDAEGDRHRIERPVPEGERLGGGVDQSDRGGGRLLPGEAQHRPAEVGAHHPRRAPLPQNLERHVARPARQVEDDGMRRQTRQLPDRHPAPVLVDAERDDPVRQVVLGCYRVEVVADLDVPRCQCIGRHG